MRRWTLIALTLGLIALIFVAAQTETGRTILWLLLTGGDGG